MNEDLKIDANSRWVLGAVTNDSNMYIRNARVNPISGALIVEANVTSSNTSIGSTIPGATQGSVFFAGLGGTLAQDNANFFWDDTSNYLGLGTNTPSETLHVVGTAIITGDVGTADQIVGRDSGTGEISGITVGSGLSLVGNTLTATGSGGSGYDTIENEGVAVTQRSTINLTNLLAASDVGGKTQLTIDVANLATDTTFIDDLIANSYFTTNLANDSTFISTLTGNSTFISDIVNIVNSSSSISINLATQVTGVLGVVNGGTGVSSVSQGDLLYGSATNTWSTLAKNTSATRYLSNTGTNNNPAWAQVDMSNGVTNTLAVGNGGTGATSHTAYAVICGGTTSTSPVQSVASVGTAGQVLTSNGAGALPTFQNPSAGLNSSNFLQFYNLDGYASTKQGRITIAGNTIAAGSYFYPVTTDTNGSCTIYACRLNSDGSISVLDSILVANGAASNDIIWNGICVIGDTIYITSGNVSIQFFINKTTFNGTSFSPITLLASNMTFSGTAPTLNDFIMMYTDGTYIYISKYAATITTFRKYSVSGSVLTYISDYTPSISITDQGTPFARIYFGNGTTQYQVNSGSGDQIDSISMPSLATSATSGVIPTSILNPFGRTNYYELSYLPASTGFYTFTKTGGTTEGNTNYQMRYVAALP